MGGAKPGHIGCKQVRLEKSKPVLGKLKTFLAQNISLIPPQNAIGKAISYTINIWPNLERYLDDGRYDIDNNIIENKTHPPALGRKNYLFADSHKAAQRAAMMYSFFATCKPNELEHFECLHKVLEKIPDHKASKL